MRGDHLTTIRAMMSKDWRLFWPFVIVLVCVQAGYAVVSATGDGGALSAPAAALGGLGALGGLWLTVAVVQQESVFDGARSDWLVQPIRRLDLLAAKVLFILLLVQAPMSLARAGIGLANGGLTLSGLLWSLAGAIVGAALILPVEIVFASLTGTMTRAIGLAVVLFVGVFALLLALGHGSVTNGPVHWIVNLLTVGVTLPLSVLALWLIYQRRSLIAGWATLAVIVAVSVLGLLIPSRWLFTLQQTLSHNADMASDVRLTLPPGCFLARPYDDGSAMPFDHAHHPELTLDQTAGTFGPADTVSAGVRTTGPTRPVGPGQIATPPDGAPSGLQLTHWRPREALRKGPEPIVFRTHVDVSGAPPNDKLIIDRVQGVYVDSDGHTVASPMSGFKLGARGGPTGLEIAWMASRDDIRRAATARFKLDYDLTLLRPVGRYVVPSDGRQWRAPGLGYCQARLTHGPGSFVRGPSLNLLLVTCTRSQSDVALIDVTAGARTSHAAPNYSPSWLSTVAFITGVGGELSEPVPRQVTVTAYRAISHFHRSVIAAPGALGGSACPVSDADAANPGAGR